MRLVRTVADLREALAPERSGGLRIGLVPTMGALHDGHLSLIGGAREESDVVVVSLFVNPTQFAAGEDFSRYPRNEGDDASVASDIGIDFLFAPSEEEMYPPGFATSIDPGPVAAGLCGAVRPGHFEGVATVVARLLGIVAPDVVYFGLKDYQQVAVVRRIIADLAMPIEMRAMPTVREPDGLAMSSRNRFLTADHRASAASIFAGLQTASVAFSGGERDTTTLVRLARETMAAAGIDVEYVELRDAETLGAYTPERAALLAVAARVGGTRLIDNVVLAPVPAGARAGAADVWSTR